MGKMYIGSIRSTDVKNTMNSACDSDNSARWSSLGLCLHTSDQFLREGNGNSLQYSCLENPMDGGAW